MASFADPWQKSGLITERSRAGRTILYKRQQSHKQLNIALKCQKNIGSRGMITRKIKGTFRHMREYNDFSDVNLVCEDGQQVEVHKVILAASSPFFQKLLTTNNHSSYPPLVYMRGVNLDDLLAIVDFLYCREANVFQENWDSYLAIAAELQPRGLMGKAYERVEDLNVGGKRPQSNSLKEHPKADAQDSKIDREKSNTTLALQSYYSGDLDQLGEMVKSMMEKSENNYRDRK